MSLDLTGSRGQRMLNKATAMLDEIERQGREPTTREHGEIQELLEKARNYAATERQFEEIGQQLGGGHTTLSGNGKGFGPSQFMTPGQQAQGPGDVFINSPQWKAISDPATRGQSWSTGAVEVGALQYKAGTLTEGAQGSGLIPVPQVIPGVVTTLFQPLGVADLFLGGLAESNAVRYVNEGTATNLAAGVAEGGTKPASDLALSTVDEPVRKIATVLTVSDELAEDAPAMQAYINNRLTLFVQLEQDRQLLRGTASPEVVGLINRTGVNTYTKGAADDNAVCLARVLANTAGSSYLYPDAIVMHPTNWLTTRLLKDGTGGTVGQFYGGGPFTQAYGNPGAVTAPQGPGFGGEIWNTRVFLSNVVGPGTALVGSFQQGAQLWSRGGVTVEVASQHASYFQQNLLMIRAESRRALTVYRPNSFTVVSGLT